MSAAKQVFSCMFFLFVCFFFLQKDFSSCEAGETVFKIKMLPKQQDKAKDMEEPRPEDQFKP